MSKSIKKKAAKPGRDPRGKYRFNMELTGLQMDAIEHAANAKRLTMSEWVRRALRLDSKISK